MPLAPLRQVSRWPYLGGALALTLLIGLVTTVAIWQDYRRQHQAVITDSQNTSRLLEGRLAETLDKAGLYVFSIAQHCLDQRGLGSADCRDVLPPPSRFSVKLPVIAATGITDAAGRIVRILDDPVRPMFGAEDIRGEPLPATGLAAEWFQSARLSAGRPAGEVIVTGPMRLFSDSPPSLLVARGVQDAAGAFIGAAFVLVPVERLQRLFDGVDLGLHGFAAVRHVDTRLVWRAPPLDRPGYQPGARPNGSALVDAVQGSPYRGSVVVSPAYDERRRVVTYGLVPGYPFYLLVGHEQEAAMAAWWRGLQLSAALAAMLIAAVWISAFAMYRAASRRVGALAQRLIALVESSGDAIIGTSAAGHITTWNRAAERLFGHRAEDVIGLPQQALDMGGTEAEIAQLREDQRRHPGAPVALETRRRRKDGSWVDVALTVSPIADEHGRQIGASTIARDITRQKRAEAEVMHLAYHDGLTGLPNRRRLMDRLTHALALGQRQQRHTAVLFIDMDRFKWLNDTHGHQAGDRLLVEVARRLLRTVRDSDTVARLGGDEFVVVCEDMGADLATAQASTTQVALKVAEALSAAYDLDGLQHRCTASVGTAVFGPDVLSADQALSAADHAMFDIKRVHHAAAALTD